METFEKLAAPSSVHWVLVSVVLAQHIHPSVRVITHSAIGSVSTNVRYTVMYKKVSNILIDIEARDIRIAETSTLNSTVQST